MSSGSIQIAAQGMQDVYLNGTPEVSYFTGVFRRHSTFLLQSAEYPFDTPVQFGGSGKVKIPYRGDLLLGTTLKVTLPELFTPGQGWVYPLATNSDYVPWVKDQATLAKIRTNLPTFKTYFSDGANTITYINRSVPYYNTYSPYGASITANVAFSNVLNFPITYSQTELLLQDGVYNTGDIVFNLIDGSNAISIYSNLTSNQISNISNVSSNQISNISLSTGFYSPSQLATYITTQTSNIPNVTFSNSIFTFDSSVALQPGLVINSEDLGQMIGLPAKQLVIQSYSDKSNTFVVSGSLVKQPRNKVILNLEGSFTNAPYSTSQVITATDQVTLVQGHVIDCTTQNVTITVDKFEGTFLHNDWQISLYSPLVLIQPGQNLIGSSYSSNVVVNSVGKSTMIVKMDDPQNIRPIVLPQEVTFRNGSVNICQASITSSTRTVPQLIRLICIQSTNGTSIEQGDQVTGLPYTGIVKVQETLTKQEYSSNGVSFNYNTVDVVCFTDQIIQPIVNLTPVSFVRSGSTIATAKIISPSCIPWVRNDFMYVTYNPVTSGFTFKSMYPIVKPLTSVNMNVSNVSPISVGMNISGISTLTGNVTVSSIEQRRAVTPTRFGSAEYFSLPGTTAVKISYSETPVATSNVSYTQYPSQFDYSNVNIEYRDFRFENGIIVKYVSNLNPVGIISGFTGYQNQILTLFDTALPLPGNIIPVSIHLNLNMIAVANLSVNNSIYITTTNFAPSAVISNVTIVGGLTVAGLPVQTSDVRTLSNTFTSNIISVTFSAQPVVPISASNAVTFSNSTSTVSGTVSYTYFSQPITISKLAFPSQQSCVFWGCDPSVVTFSGARV